MRCFLLGLICIWLRDEAERRSPDIGREELGGAVGWCIGMGGWGMVIGR